jgi:hypothetical protein
MYKEKSSLNTLGIMVVLLLIGGTGFSTILFNSVYAQNTTILGEPFFVEQGKTTNEKEIGPNRTQFTISSNGTMNGNIEVTDTAVITAISIGNNLEFDQGHGITSTRDGSEMANYTLIAVESIPESGNISFRGAAVFSTNSTGELSFLNGMLGIFRGEEDTQSGNFVSREWEWK